MFAEKLSDKANFAVCTCDDEMAGFTAYYLNCSARQVYITLICVDSMFQSHGIGGKMIDWLSSLAKKEGYTSIALEVNKVNGKAHRFYVKHGFVEQEDRCEKLLMKKTL